MDFRTFSLLFLFLLCAIDDIHAKRFGGSSRSSGKSSGHTHSSSTWKSSGTSSTSHHTSNWNYYKPSSSGNTPHNYGSGSSTHGTSFGSTHASTPHGQTSSQNRGTSAGTNTPHEQNKAITTSFLNAEGGGATRPGTQPSAPPTPLSGSTHMSNPGGIYGTQTSGQYGKPSVVTDSKQMSSPYSPSAPPHIPKTSFNPVQTQAPTSFGHPSTPFNAGQGQATGTNPPWSNPHFGTNHQVPSGSPQSNIGFKDHIYNPSTSHGANTPYIPHAGNPPYPTSHGVNPPYPVSHGVNTPYPTSHGVNPPYPTSHGVNTPYPNTFNTHLNQQPVGGQAFGHGSYPHSMPPVMSGHVPPYSNSFGHPSQVPMGNPYSMHPAGNPYATSGHAYYPQQQPHVLAQPAAQPFVPGQTVIMVPGQQDSGRGIGQIFKEALVFSTVNAGVNRLLNPHHHYVSESRPDSGTTGTTTHITYNNQYFNTAPGANGTVDPISVPQGGFPNGGAMNYPNYPSGASVPSNMPIGGMSPSPGNTNFQNIPSMTTMGAVNNGGSIPSSGVGAVGPVTGGTTVGGVTGAAMSQSNISSKPENRTSTANVNPTFGYKISDNELFQITEELFAKDTLNVSKYITLNLQKRVTSPNATDEAKELLFNVQSEVFDHPSIYVTRALYDNYENDSRKKENRTLEERQEENLLIDTFLNTNVMATAMKWLSDHGFIDPDDFEKQDILRHMWFNHFDGTTSGFERVFVSEKYADSAILGVQDWLYFEYEETQKRINYMGYVDKLDLGDRASLLKLNFEMDGIVRPNATIFVGTLPELEMSLYTICFYARPNNLCPVSLGGSKFNIFTHSFRHFGNDLIDLALPIF